jgi:hypothetical protein
VFHVSAAKKKTGELAGDCDMRLVAHFSTRDARTRAADALCGGGDLLRFYQTARAAHA